MNVIRLTIVVAVFGLFIHIQSASAQTSDDYVNRATAASNKGDIDGFFSNSNEAIRLDPRNAVAYYQRGTAYSLQNKFAEALADAAKVIELRPELSVGYVLHGLSLIELRPNDWKIVMADYDKAIEVNPESAEALRLRAKLHNNNDLDFAAALADAGQAIKLDPSNAYGYYFRGIAYENLKNWAAAESDYSQTIKLGKSFEALYTHRGIVNLHLGIDNSDQARRDQAIADLRKALAFEPNDKQLKENLEFAISKGSVTKPSDSTPVPTSSNSAAIMLGFYNLYNKTYDNAMPKAEKLFQKLKTHRYPAPQIIVVDPHCNYCLKTTTEVNKYKSDQKEFAQNLLRALGAMRAILNNSDVKELTAEQRQYCQDRLDKAVALENEAGAWFAKH